MRFLMMVKSSKESEAGAMPDEKLLTSMGKFNEELQKAGVLLDLAGLQPSSKGARVYFANGKRSVVDGPFSEAKELVGGYWVVQMKSLEEAIEWAKRVPFDPTGPAAHRAGVGEIEIRQVFEASDFSPDLYPSSEARELMKAEGEFRKRTNT